MPIGLEGCDHSVLLGDGLRIVDLLTRLMVLPSPTDTMITTRLYMFILACWRQQDDRPMLHHARVRDEITTLASVLCWLGGTLPPAATTNAVVAGLGRQALLSLSGGFRRIADGIETECETRPKHAHWAFAKPLWIVLSTAFRPWASELSRVLGDPVLTKTV